MSTTATLFEHEDGRHAVWNGTDSPPWTIGDPKWHRVGPVDVSSIAPTHDASPAAAVQVLMPEPVGVMRAAKELEAAPYADIFLWLEPGTKLLTETEVRAALLAGVSAPAALAVIAPTAQDSCCAWSVWWTHDKAKHTTTRQASIAAWDAGIAYALERTAPQAQADTRDARIYTYSQQPTDNVIAWRIGEACSKARPGGDYIDHGLSLLQQLQEKGYGITAIATLNEQGVK